jgi:hypothetical protein
MTSGRLPDLIGGNWYEKDNPYNIDNDYANERVCEHWLD